jgi:hypothetical protein
MVNISTKSFFLVVFLSLFIVLSKVNTTMGQTVTITSVSPASGTGTAPLAVTVSYTIYYPYATVTYYVDGSNVGSANPSYGTNQWGTPSLSAGTHTLSIKGPSNTACTSYTVNSPPPPPPAPTISITSVSPASGTQTAPASVTINCTATQAGWIYISLDGSQMYSTYNTSASYTYSLNAGTHTLGVQISNSNGSNSASTSYVVNAPPPPPPPSISITSVSPASGTQTAPASATIQCTSTQAGWIYVLLDGSQVYSTYSTSASYTYTGLTAGTHTLSVQISNSNGSNSASTSYVVRSPAPTISITSVSPASGTLTAPASVTINCTATQAGLIYVLLDGSQVYSANNNSISYTYTNLTAGTHTLGVSITNSAGSNSASTSYVVLVPQSISLSTTSISVPYTGGQASFTISNTGGGTLNWSVISSDTNWLKISPASGTNSGTVTITYLSNAGLQRTGKITVSAAGATNTPQTITVTQAPAQASFTISPDTLNMGNVGGAASFTITNTGGSTLTWSASSNSSWSTISPQNGTINSGDSVIQKVNPKNNNKNERLVLSSGNSVTVSVYDSANTGGSRTGIITVSANGLPSQTVTVLQATTQPTISLSTRYITVPYTSGSTSFSINNIGSGTLNWTAASNVTWMTVSPSNGTNSGTVTLTDSLNTRGYRVGTITVSAAGATNTPQTIEVIQTGTPEPMVSITSVSPQSGTAYAPVNVTISYSMGIGAYVNFYIDNLPQGNAKATSGTNLWTPSLSLSAGTHTLSIAGPLDTATTSYQVLSMPKAKVSDDNINNIPLPFTLEKNYPNPFNPTTIINWQLSENNFVSLKVYDMLGREVKTLVNGYKTQGNYSVSFDASNLASGIYIYQLRAGNFISTKKMILMK